MCVKVITAEINYMANKHLIIKIYAQQTTNLQEGRNNSGDEQYDKTDYTLGKNFKNK